MTKANINKVLNSEYIVLLAIIVISAILRFYHLRTIPDWYQDEGEFIHLADYLAKGNLDYLGIRDSILLMGRPPLFSWVLAGLFQVFRIDILVVRSLTVMCSILTISICYILTKQAVNKTSAFYTAFLMAILPDYIFYNRIGFSYNWTSLWIVIFIFSIYKYLTMDRKIWLSAACIAAGVAFASDYLGLACVIALVIIILFTQPSQLWKLVIVPIPWLISMLPVVLADPRDIWHDLTFTYIWGSGGGASIFTTIATMIAKYSQTFTSQPLIVLGLIGIFILSNSKLRTVLLLTLGSITLLLLPGRILFAQYLLPIWPVIMIGLGNFLQKSISFLHTTVASSVDNLEISWWQRVDKNARSVVGKICSAVVLFILIFLPITWLLLQSLGGVVLSANSTSFGMGENPFFAGYVPAEDAEAIASEIDSTLAADSFVVAPGVISWMIPGNAADPRIVAIYDYDGILPGLVKIKTDRFIVNSSLSNARYAVVDNTWRNWMVNMAPEIGTMLEEVQKWPLVMERGSLQLYCNPRYCP